MARTWWIYPARRFAVGDAQCVLKSRARTDGLVSSLRVDGVEVASDHTPIGGEEAVRNHRLIAKLPDDTLLDVELGYRGTWTTGIIARADGRIVHESHPGTAIGYPEKYRAQAISMGAPTIGAALKQGYHDGVQQGRDAKALETGAFAKRNRIPIVVDIASGLLFFAVAKLTDLTTAALVGAAVGIGLVLFQRITKIDVTGGLALFTIVMLLISAGLALAFQDEEFIKLRGTITGLIAASLFLGDGLLGGKRLASGLTRYMPYSDIDPGRLGIGMGVLGAVMAGLNYAVARLASTDAWLFYTTFLDMLVAFALFFVLLRFARSGRREVSASPMLAEK